MHTTTSQEAQAIPAREPMAAGRRWIKRADLVAGLTTAVMLVPQAMAYAMLAGLPPITGLYASTLPLVLYAILGRSPVLAVGPVAMDSMLVAASVGTLAAVGTTNYLTLAVGLAAMMGAIQLVLGLLKAGGAVSFLSAPVLSGFTSAAAIIIATSQVSALIGVKSAGAGSGFAAMLWQLIVSVPQTHALTAVMGVVSVAGLLAMKRWAPRWPSALVVVGLGSAVVWGFGLSDAGVWVVGEVPSGLPSLSLDAILGLGGAFSSLLPAAATLALVGFAEAYSVGKALQPKGAGDLNPNRELVALGAANISASLIGGYPITGGLSRSAVNARAGAKSRVAGLVTAGVVLLSLLVLTPAFRFVPVVVLAAVILTAVSSLVDWTMVRHLHRIKRTDLALLLLTFALTLFVGMAEGLLGGVAASVLWLAIRQSRPHVAVLGRLPGTTTYRNVKRYPEVERFPGLLILRPDAPLYFGNCQFLKQYIEQFAADPNQPLRAVILDASAISDIDASGEAMLRTLIQDAHRQQRRIYIAAAHGPVRDVLTCAGLDTLLKTPLLHEVNDAVEHALAS